MAVPSDRGITNPVIDPNKPSPVDRARRGEFITTNRDNQGSWTAYLEALRRTPGSGATRNTYGLPEDRKPVRPLTPNGRAPQAQTSSAASVNRYGAGQQVEAGSPMATYAAGLRHYGAGMRSAPNVGAVRNKGGYNARDRRVAAADDRLATGESSRIRLMGG